MAMGSKENSDNLENWWSAPASPIEILQKFSKNAVKRASDSWNSSHTGSPNLNTPDSEQIEGHRRTSSDVASSFPRSTSSINFQKWKSQVQRALYWRSRSFCEDRQYFSFDPEILANQKRQWYKIQSRALDPDKFKEPSSLFEHFIIVGLRPDANLEVLEDTFYKKRCGQEMARTEMSDFNTRTFQQPTCPVLEPQVLFKYPPGKKLALRFKDLASFCFPGGVKAGVLKRTPSLSELNEQLYGQGHLYRDDSSFVFSVKVADSAALYGVCLHVQELVQESPAMSGVSSPFSPSQPASSRFLGSAPRCYCILTKVPFFELHFEMLNSIIAQKHLNRISQFANEAFISDYAPSPSIPGNHITGNDDSPCRERYADWMSAAIPVDVMDDEVAPSTWEICSPDSATADDLTDHSRYREFDADGGRSTHGSNDCTSEKSEKMSGGLDHICPMNDQFSEMSFSSAVSTASEEEVDDIFYDYAKDVAYDMRMENKSDLLQIITNYHSLPVPPRGSEIVYKPLEHLDPIEYCRLPLSALGFSGKYVDFKLNDSTEVSQVKIKLAAAEEALALSLWSTATICRVLSLESILALVTSVLLEKQVVVFCPNLGVLSAAVLSLIPIIRPFEWQSLFLPILPLKMLDFIDAPVPFIVGLQEKPDNLKMRTSHLVQVNVAKNQVKSRDLPQLPHNKGLISELRPIHAVLSRVDYTSQKHPVYKCDKMQAKAAEQFLAIMRRYMESLCSDLKSHMITSVQSNNDRVSILLKDSFIDSFPYSDQHFVKLFVETQLFTVLSDSRLSSFDNEHNS